MNAPVLLAVYCLAIIAASIAGGLIPILVRLTHTRLQLAISLTAGFMFGVAVLHMVPHAIETPGVTASSAMLWVLFGFLVMFFIERFFSFHTHEVAEVDDSPEHAHTHGSKLSWTGAAIGLTLHSVIAGVALASAVAAESGEIVAGDSAGHNASSALAGLAVFLVIVLHKPLDALTVITLTASAGFAKPTRHLINGLFALAVPVGVVLFGLGLSQSALAESGTLVGHALAFSAGTFFCIALSDLLPELHFHSHDRGKLSAALIVGVALAFAMAKAEHSMHDHDHAHGSHDHKAAETAPLLDDDHAGHDHDEHHGHDHPPKPEVPSPAVPSEYDAHDHSGHDHSGHNH